MSGTEEEQERLGRECSNSERPEDCWHPWPAAEVETVIFPPDVEPAGGLSWYWSCLRAVRWEVACVSGYLVDPGTRLSAFAFAGEKEA